MSGNNQSCLYVSLKHNVGMAKKPARSRDVNQIAKNIIDQMTGDAPREVPPTKNPAAVELGRRGGLVGGKARAAKLSAKKRKDIAKKAAKARWRGQTS
jgi:hypothetical protein